MQSKTHENERELKFNSEKLRRKEDIRDTSCNVTELRGWDYEL